MLQRFCTRANLWNSKRSKNTRKTVIIGQTLRECCRRDAGSGESPSGPEDQADLLVHEKNRKLKMVKTETQKAAYHRVNLCSGKLNYQANEFNRPQLLSESMLANSVMPGASSAGIV